MTEEWRVTTLKEWIRPVPEAAASGAFHGAGTRLEVAAGTLAASSSDTYRCTFPHVADGDWDTDGYIPTTGTRLWTVPAGLGGVYQLELFIEVPSASLPTVGYVQVGFLLPDARSVHAHRRWDDFIGGVGNRHVEMYLVVTTTLHAGDSIEVFIENATDVTVIAGAIQGRNRFSGWLLIPDPVPGTP